MIAEGALRPTVESGNIRLIDRTRDGVAVQVAFGIVLEESLNRWFSRHRARGPWRDLGTGGLEALTSPESASSSILYALDLPADLLDTFRDRYAGRLLKAVGDEPRKAVLSELRDVVKSAAERVPGVTVREVRTFDVAFSPPGSASTAFDARSGKFVGLHLDDHEGLGFEDRSRGFQLLSVNLGRAERYFQFINHDTRSLLRSIGGVESLPDEARSAASLVQRFFAEHADCPVLRLILRPGQGYVAVTQDMIHDGATNDLGRPDVNALLGGRFDIEGIRP